MAWDRVLQRLDAAEKRVEELAKREPDPREARLPVTLPDRTERAFGEYSVGRYMWLLTRVHALPERVPAKGMLQLWEWPAPRWVVEIASGWRLW